MDNVSTPWFPLRDLPQLPVGIEIEGSPEEVILRCVYSFYGHEQDLLIDIAAEVFGCFSETAGPVTHISDDYPRLKNPKFDRYLWPLMEVENSTWLALHRDKLWFPDQPYKHYRVVSDDGTFDAISANRIFARWVRPKD
ncbi:hypothetical protein [Sphingomonas psychrotolerans]|nr:hypothetical protein [Sphingomonas psychrotolerans]